MNSKNIFDQFSSITDFRQSGKIKHPLVNIITITLCATLCGADDWDAIEDYGHAKFEWLSSFLDMSSGVPSHDTISRVFSLLDPIEFQDKFILWVQNVIKKMDNNLVDNIQPVVAVDGKTLRRSHDKKNSKTAIHMVNAWCTQNSLALGQIKTEQKSNEITAVPQLLSLLDIKDKLVTADAMSCQKEIVKVCIKSEADYLIAVKNNQPTLFKEIENHFHNKKDKNYKRPRIDFFRTEEKNRDRYEIRKCWISPVINQLSMKDDWEGLKTIVCVENIRTLKKSTSVERRYYICSKDLTAEKALHACRSHWQVESFHWMLDMGFREDESRSRNENLAENMAVIRQIALNALKLETKTKRGIKRKRFNAGLSDEYLKEILMFV